MRAECGWPNSGAALPAHAAAPCAAGKRPRHGRGASVRACSYLLIRGVAGQLVVILSASARRERSCASAIASRRGRPIWPILPLLAQLALIIPISHPRDVLVALILMVARLDDRSSRGDAGERRLADPNRGAARGLGVLISGFGAWSPRLAGAAGRYGFRSQRIEAVKRGRTALRRGRSIIPRSALALDRRGDEGDRRGIFVWQLLPTARDVIPARGPDRLRPAQRASASTQRGAHAARAQAGALSRRGRLTGISRIAEHARFVWQRGWDRTATCLSSRGGRFGTGHYPRRSSRRHCTVGSRAKRRSRWPVLAADLSRRSAARRGPACSVGTLLAAFITAYLAKQLASPATETRRRDRHA